MTSQIMPYFGQKRELVAIGAEGNYITFRDMHGKEHRCLDVGSACRNVPLGYKHPEIMACFSEGFYVHPYRMSHPAVENYAKRLCALTGMSQAVFGNSGSEAVDIAVRLAWQSFAQDHINASRRVYILSIEGAYHGSTTIPLLVSGGDYYRTFIPQITGDETHRSLFVKLPHPLSQKDTRQEIYKRISGIEDQIAAIIFEPVLGVAGAIPLPEAYVETLGEISKNHGARLIADEITTGFGRTGTMFGFQQYNITPDMICVAKAITNGDFPLSAVLYNQQIIDGVGQSRKGDTIEKYMYGHTTSQHLTGCLIGDKVLTIIERDSLVKKVKEQGEELEVRLHTLQNRTSSIRAVRGKGFLHVVTLSDAEKTERITTYLLDHGIILGGGESTLSVVPPYALSQQEMDYFLDTLTKAIAL